MPLVLLILRLLTGFGSIFRLGSQGFKWFRKRGKVPAPVVRPRFDWDLDEDPPNLRFRVKNDGSRSAIVDEVAVTLRQRDGTIKGVPLPADFEDRYPIQVKPDESSAWFEVPLKPDHVAILREREKLAKARALAARGDEQELVDNGIDGEAPKPKQPEQLASGFDLLIVHEHGRKVVRIPGPWELAATAAAAPATATDDDTTGDSLDDANTVLDDDMGGSDDLLADTADDIAGLS